MQVFFCKGWRLHPPVDNNSLLPPLDYFRFVGKRTLRLFLDMPYLILCLLRGPLNNNRLPRLNIMMKRWVTRRNALSLLWFLSFRVRWHYMCNRECSSNLLRRIKCFHISETIKDSNYVPVQRIINWLLWTFDYYQRTFSFWNEY